MSAIGIGVGETGLARGKVQAGRNSANINKTVRVFCAGIPLGFIIGLIGLNEFFSLNEGKVQFLDNRSTGI